MEGDRSLKARELSRVLRPPLVLVGLVLIAGCGIIDRTEPQPPDDDRKRPGPLDTWLAVESVEPSAPRVSTNPRIEIEFNAYLDDDSFAVYNVGSLSSAGLSWSGWADYNVTERTIVWTPRSTVPSGVDIQFALADRLRSVTGAPLKNAGPIASFTTSPNVAPPDEGPGAAPRWDDISAIFDDHCNGCHGTERWEGLVPLEYGAIVGEPSAQVDRLLVRPFDASDSYLLQKLLEGYPTIRNTIQPPPWSDEERLTHRETRAVERWIDAGAPR